MCVCNIGTYIIRDGVHGVRDDSSSGAETFKEKEREVERERSEEEGEERGMREWEREDRGKGRRREEGRDITQTFGTWRSANRGYDQGRDDESGEMMKN